MGLRIVHTEMWVSTVVMSVQVPSAALMAAAAVTSDMDGLLLSESASSLEDLELHALMESLMRR